MLLKVSGATPGLYENSLIWTPYDGFANGLNRYEVVKKNQTMKVSLANPWQPSAQ